MEAGEVAAHPTPFGHGVTTMRLRSTTRVGTTLIEYMTFLFILMFFLFAFCPSVRNWVDNVFH
jgi:hypothetical protein